MYFVNSYFTVAIYLSVLVAVLFALLRWRNSVASENRLQRMMMCCGIDENIAANADQLLKIDMSAVRHRCRHCPVTYLCDSWLDGEAVATNGFCPNAWIFRDAATASQP